jgi:hypothetical protein
MENKSKLYWRTRDGRVMDVDDMTDTHVRNAFKLLLRALKKEQERRNPVERTIQLNGDIANDFNDSMEAFEYDDVDPYFDQF